MNSILMEVNFLKSDPQSEITEIEIEKHKNRIDNHQSIIRFLITHTDNEKVLA